MYVTSDKEGYRMWDRFGYFIFPLEAVLRGGISWATECWCLSFPVSPGPAEVEQIRQCLRELPGHTR